MTSMMEGEMNTNLNKAIIIFAILLCACGASPPSAEDIQTAIAETQMAEGQLAEATDEPILEIQPTELMQLDSVQDVVGMPSDIAEPTNEGILTSNQNDCDVSNWEIIPIDIIEENIGDGWKYVLIYVAAFNNNANWSSLTSFTPPHRGVPTLITEDGFEYQTIDYVIIPDDPQGCYSEGAYTISCDGNTINNFNILPPYYKFLGQHFVFKIAESQNQYKFSLDGNAACFLPGENRKDGDFSILIDVNENTIEYPVDEEFFEFNELLGGKLEIPEVGTIEFTRIERSPTKQGNEDALFIYFDFINLSKGYNSEGEVDGYIIGDDGIIRDPGCLNNWNFEFCKTLEDRKADGWFRAGPGQTTDGIIGIKVPRETSNLKFVVTYQMSYSKYLLEVFDINKDDIVIRE